MNYRMIIHVLGYVLLIIAVLMLLPLIAGLFFRENILNFLITSLLTAILGVIMLLIRPKKQDLYARDGFAIVGVAHAVFLAQDVCVHVMARHGIGGADAVEEGERLLFGLDMRHLPDEAGLLLLVLGLRRALYGLVGFHEAIV